MSIQACFFPSRGSTGGAERSPATIQRRVSAGSITSSSSNSEAALSALPRAALWRLLGRADLPIPAQDQAAEQGWESAVARWTSQLGEHNAEVLASALGLSPIDIAALAETGIIGTEPRAA